MTNTDLNFKDTASNENSAILGTLEGPCASFVQPTRNGRKYGENLWENVFKDPIVKEMLENGGIPGELDHPADREETCSEKIAIMMSEAPTKKDGKLWAKFNILNTPNGKIAYTLAKAGFKLGISSRGSGDVIQGRDGEYVDEDTYEFKAFDLVLLPAVKEARLTLVTESLDRKFNYRKALNESLNSATEDERKIMLETLNNLKITLDEEYDESSYNKSFVFRFHKNDNTLMTNEFLAKDKDDAEKQASKFAKDNSVEKYELLNDVTDETSDDIDITESTDIAADNDGAKLVEQLQEALAENATLENKIKQLQENLSACYARETAQEERVSTLIHRAARLGEAVKTVKALKQKVNSLTEELDEKSNSIESLKNKIISLNENLSNDEVRNENYVKDIEYRDNQIKSLERQISSLNESIQSTSEVLDTEKEQLKEQIETLKKDSAIKNKEYSTKLSSNNALIEKYRGIARKAVDKYIESKATMLGVSTKEIKSRLGENYSFNDIDSLCEDLQQYKLNINRLPFDVGNGTPKMKITESKQSSINKYLNEDDDVDEQLLRMANLR